MTQNQDRTNWVDNLRSFITVLVVAHHSSLAYTTFAHFNKEAYITSTHPIVDAARSRGLDIFEDFNDIFFMSLMFLIGGIFMSPGLRNKGVPVFIRDRFYRLFIPFIIGVTILMLLAYYPAYYLAHGQHDLRDYIVDYFTVEAWPVGPPWFIWVLFLFNIVFAVCFPLIKDSPMAPGAWLTAQSQRPWKLLLCWYLLTWLLYMPMALFIDPGMWTGIGPFDFQVSRIFLYFGYFLLGAVIGVPGLRNGIFSADSRLVRMWPVWAAAAVFVYALLKGSETPLRTMIGRGELSYFNANLLYRSVWTLSCTLSCMAFLTTFRSIFNITGSIWKSLSANAYGIYLVHYIFVIWCQYFLLDIDMAALLKFLITVVLSVTFSWALTWILRRNGLIRRYL
ncbi:MAG TPA: acyltransferase [Chitinophaga sp.]|uniref:acyltransferase n=1 Tax=Chitinophaga sp. TaxID=1869181 RepID=UPI002C826FF9|nr:acyltransferase [Chitinophaga sp.]HVI43417.1 acyltransferase [Chitinophaga sp.]